MILIFACFAIVLTAASHEVAGSICEGRHCFRQATDDADTSKFMMQKKRNRALDIHAYNVQDESIESLNLLTARRITSKTKLDGDWVDEKFEELSAALKRDAAAVLDSLKRHGVTNSQIDAIVRDCAHKLYDGGEEITSDGMLEILEQEGFNGDQAAIVMDHLRDLAAIAHGAYPHQTGVDRDFESLSLEQTAQRKSPPARRRRTRRRRTPAPTPTPTVPDKVSIDKWQYDIEETKNMKCANFKASISNVCIKAEGDARCIPVSHERQMCRRRDSKISDNIFGDYACQDNIWKMQDCRRDAGYCLDSNYLIRKHRLEPRKSCLQHCHEDQCTYYSYSTFNCRTYSGECEQLHLPGREGDFWDREMTTCPKSTNHDSVMFDMKAWATENGFAGWCRRRSQCAECTMGTGISDDLGWAASWEHLDHPDSKW